MSGLPWPFRVATVVVLCLALGFLVVNLVLVVVGLLMTGVLHLLPYSPHRPPSVPGCPSMTVRRVQRLWWWNQCGYRHGTTKGSWVRRRVAGALFLGWWAMAPAMLALQFWMTARRSTRYYVDPRGAAVLAITGHRKHWSIGDHASAKPGSQQGRRFRQLLLPTLTAHADAHGIAITTNAAVPPWRPATPKASPACATWAAPYRADERCAANQPANPAPPRRSPPRLTTRP